MYQAAHRKAVAKGHTNARPEHRLYNAMIGSIGIPVGLFWFAWCADKGVHWAVLCVSAVPFAWGNLSLFVSSNSICLRDMVDMVQTSAALYMIDMYGPMNGASAMAANGIVRYTFGAVFPLFTFQSKIFLSMQMLVS
jgi:hypothetical protein